MLFLDINDYNLAVRGGQVNAHGLEVGAISASNGNFTFATEALQRSRSHPQNFNNKYLYALASDPVAGDLRPAKNHADLIYHHLKALAVPEGEPLVLGVHGHVTNAQLGLLLGICQEIGIDVRGFVDLALAQSCRYLDDGTHYIFDIELHRSTLTEITHGGGTCAVTRTDAFDDLGVSHIVDGWMNVIADEFVQKTRFDPLHAGDSEQQLFNQVWSWLGTQTTLQENAKQRIAIGAGEANREIELSQTLLLQKLKQRAERVALPSGSHILITPRVRTVPGLAKVIGAHAARLTELQDTHIVEGYSKLANELEPGNVRRINQLSYDTQTDAPIAPSAAPEPSSNVVLRPTHLLNDHVAQSIEHNKFADAAIADLRIGDEISIANKTYTAIRIE